MLYPTYINPKNHKKCSFENTLKRILRMRENETDQAKIDAG
jgi:capsule polysaccharide export protein KpsC/LpsZ